MKFIETFFALIGVSATVSVVFFYIGYITVCPPCNSALAVFTETCK